MNHNPERAILRAAVWSCLISPVGLILSLLALRDVRRSGTRPPGLLQFALWNSILGIMVGVILIAMIVLLLQYTSTLVS